MTGSEMGGLFLAAFGIILIVAGALVAIIGLIITIFHPFGLYLFYLGVTILILGGGLLTLVLWVDDNRQRARLANASAIPRDDC